MLGLFLLLLNSCTTPDANTKSKHNLALQQIELIACPPPDTAALFPGINILGFMYADEELKFAVSGITLGVKTPGAEKRNAQVSNKGVHLHVVLNDSIHLLHYDNLIPFKLSDGNYKIAAFVTRSYHESIKTNQAAILRDVVLKNGKTVKSYPNSSATLVYSAPIGHFKGKDTENIVLDFRLINTTLSPEGNKVKVTIDHQFEFMIDQWQAYYIKGLVDGQHHIQMELLNAEGQLRYGPVYQQIECLSEEN